MHTTEHAAYIVSLTVAEFRAIKRAITTLTRAHITLPVACDVVITAHRENRQELSRYRERAS